MTAKPLIKTPIAYQGGKQSIIHELLQLIPEHEIYTETFFGGGSLFWAKEPVLNETINDRLDIVINFYVVLRTKYKQLKKLIDLSLISRTMHQQAINICKKRVPADRVTQAWAFWYCSNFSFANKIGGGIKYANEQNTVICTTLLNKKKEFTEKLCSRIENTQIENNDAINILKSRNTPGAFHHIDTPYPGTDQGIYAGYKVSDLEHILKWLAIDCKGKFLLTNYKSEILDIYIDQNGWNKKEIVRRTKAQLQSKAEKIEVLVYNYDIQISPNLFTQQ
jgi:DNA adenine methylase